MRQWLAAALALAVAACAAPSRPTLGAAPDLDAPLAARLFPPYYGSVAVQLSKPAYVALFELVPGRGVSLVYPQGGSGFQQATESWVPMRYSANRWLYAADLPGRGGYQRAAFSSGYDRQYGYDPYGLDVPRYLFLVASEEPLAVDQFQGDPASLRTYLGHARYSAYDPYEVMERLAYAMLPFASADSWVMDVYVDYGYDWGYGHGPGVSAAQASYWPVACRDGSVHYVRYVAGWGYSSIPCGGASYVAPPGTVVPRPPLDTTAAPVPAGRGRDRTATPDSAGRARAGTAEPLAPRRADDPEVARTRQRIAELRDDAAREDFGASLTSRLRRDVSMRQRAALLRGHVRPTHLTADAEYAPGDAAAPRARAGSPRSPRSREAESLGASTQAIPRMRGSAGSERARVQRERPAPPPRSSTASPTRSSGEPPPSAGSSSSGSSSSGERRSSGSSSGSSGGRSRVPPP